MAEQEPRMADHAELVICEQSIERTLAWLSKYRRLTVRYGLYGEAGNDSLDGGTGTDTRIADPSEKSIVGFP